MDGTGHEILGELGRGGVGTVYLARHLGLDRRVAMKVLTTGDQSLAQRLVGEARVLADLDSPHIVDVYDVGEHQGRPWYTMQYCAGGTLAGVLERDRAIPTDQAVAVAVAIARGLADLHEAGIIHRDVKPGNILVTRSGAVLLGDLGTALDARADRVTTTGAVLGTLGYSAPELITGSDPTAASDVFSLGVVLYECVSGHRPFQGGHIAAVMDAIRTGEHLRVDERVDDLDAVIAEAIEQMLSTDPSERPDDLRELADRLQSVIAPSPLEPAPPVTLDPTADLTMTAIRRRELEEPVDEPEPTGRRWPVLIGLGLAVLAAGGVAIAATRGGGESEESVTSEMSSTLVGEITAPAKRYGSVEVETSWTVGEAGVAAGTTTLTNGGTETAALAHDEIIPKELVADTSQLETSPAFDSVVSSDPIVRFCLELNAGDEVVITWTGTEPTSSDDLDLEAIAEQWSDDFDGHVGSRDGEPCDVSPETTETIDPDEIAAPDASGPDPGSADGGGDGVIESDTPADAVEPTGTVSTGGGSDSTASTSGGGGSAPGPATPTTVAPPITTAAPTTAAPTTAAPTTAAPVTAAPTTAAPTTDPPNRAPTATNEAISFTFRRSDPPTTRKCGSINVLSNDSDPDGDGLTATLTGANFSSNPAGSSFSLNSGGSASICATRAARDSRTALIVYYRAIDSRGAQSNEASFRANLVFID